MSPSSLDFEAAVQAYREGKWSVAIQNFAELISSEQNRDERYESLEKLGLSYYQIEDFKASRKQFECILDEGFSLARKQVARINLGNSYLREGDISASRTEFEAVASQGGLSASLGHYGLACVCSSSRQYDQALDQLELAFLANSDLKQNAESDPYLDPIRPYVRFEEAFQLEDTVTKRTNLLSRWAEKAWWFGTSAVARGAVVCIQKSPRWLGKWVVQRGRQMIERSACSNANLHGIATRILSLDCEDAGAAGDEVLAQLNEAIELIQRCSPRQYHQLRRNLHSILVLPLPSASGRFVREYLECQLSRKLFATPEENRESSIHQIASVLVHEACHARVHAMIRNDKPDPEFREERLCREEEKRFIEKAKLDNKMPWPREYDTDYHERFGYWERWYYQQYGEREPSSRINAIMKLIRTGETESNDDFFVHIWSKAAHYAEYATDLSASLSPDSEDATAWFSRGYARYCIRQYELAMQDFQQACQLDRQNKLLWDWLATAATYASRIDIALTARREAIALSPACIDTLELLIRHHLQIGNNQSELLELTERFIQLEPFCHRAMILKSEVLQACGQSQSALELVEQAIVYHPECREGLPLASSLAEERGLSKLAQNYWESYVQAVRSTISDFQDPVERNAIVLESTIVKDHVRLSVLYSLTSDSSGIAKLAQSLIEKSDLIPATLEVQYWRALIHRSAMQSTPTEVPRSVLPNSIADDDRIRVQSITIPLRCFRDSSVPVVLQTIPMTFDRANDHHIQYVPTLPSASPSDGILGAFDSHQAALMC